MILSSCSGQLARPQGPVSLTPASEIETTTLDLSECKTGETPIGVAMIPAVGAIAAVGVDFAVNLVSNLLKDRQAKRNAVWSASGIADVAKLSAPDDHCNPQLLVQRAVLDSGGNVIPTPGFKLTGELAIKRIAGPAGADGKPAPDRLEIRFKANQFDYGHTAAPTHGSGRKHVVILIAFTDTSPLKSGAATGNEDLPNALRIDLGTLRDGATYNASMLSSVNGMTVVSAPTSGSFVMTAIVVETEDELLALKTLSDAYDANKDKLTAALRAALGIKDN